MTHFRMYLPHHPICTLLGIVMCQVSKINGLERGISLGNSSLCCVGMGYGISIVPVFLIPFCYTNTPASCTPVVTVKTCHSV